MPEPKPPSRGEPGRIEVFDYGDDVSLRRLRPAARVLADALKENAGGVGPAAHGCVVARDAANERGGKKELLVSAARNPERVCGGFACRAAGFVDGVRGENVADFRKELAHFAGRLAFQGRFIKREAGNAMAGAAMRAQSLRRVRNQLVSQIWTRRSALRKTGSIANVSSMNSRSSS